MNLLLFSPDEIKDCVAEISGRRADHIIKILKSEKDDTLKAGVINGPLGTATVLSVKKDTVTLSFAEESPPPEPPDVSVVIALPRPKVFRRIIFMMVSAGVKDIHIINSWRVEKSYWESPYIGAEHTDRYILDALAQSKDTVLPKISFHRFFMQFMQEGLGFIPERRRRYLAHPYSAESNMPKLPCCLAVGPEGGFVEKEIKTFEKYGFSSFSLGERILTTEHFVPFVLGCLMN